MKTQVLNPNFLAKDYYPYTAWYQQDKFEVTNEHVYNAELEDSITGFSLLPTRQQRAINYSIIVRFFLTHLFCFIQKHRRSVLHYLKSFLTWAGVEMKESFLIFKHMVWYISQEGRKRQLNLFLALYFYFMTKIFY